MANDVVLGIFNLTNEQQEKLMTKFDTGNFTEGKNDFSTFLNTFSDSDHILVSDAEEIGQPGSIPVDTSTSFYYTNFYNTNSTSYDYEVLRRQNFDRHINPNDISVRATYRDISTSKNVTINKSVNLPYLNLKLKSEVITRLSTVEHAWNIHVLLEDGTYKRLDKLQLSIWLDNHLGNNLGGDGSRSLYFNTFILFSVKGNTMYPFYVYKFPTQINSNKIILNFPDNLIGGI